MWKDLLKTDRAALRPFPIPQFSEGFSAWSITSNAAIPLLTALWGLLASIIGPRAAIAIAGVLLLATPLLLPRSGVSRDERGPAEAGQDSPRLATAES